MLIDRKRAAELLCGSDNILILTHKSPDGDTLGCGIALYHALKSLGKHVRVENNDRIPKRFGYLFEGVDSEEFEPEFIAAVDIADTKLIGDELEPLYSGRVDLCIDHHGTNTGYARETLLNPDDAAASLTVYKLLKEMGITVTPAIASALYTGIATDTGCFRFTNTTPECLRVCADLMDAGAHYGAINIAMFETKPRPYYDLLSEVLSGMRVLCDGKVIVFKITNEMFERTGASGDLCEAIAAISRQVEGAVCGITMKQTKNGSYKFSLRTFEPVDASVLCAAFGGGGHMRAAGCDAKAGEEEILLAKLLEMVEEQLKKQP